MAHYCWTCSNEVFFAVKVGIKVGRHDECAHCGADLKCCKNCSSHDTSVHNQCTEPTAEFIRDRERANFCTHFTFRDGDAPTTSDDEVAKAKAKLEDLFKNLK